MKFLLLNGHGICFKVDRAKLYIKNGFSEVGEEPEEYLFTPKRIPYQDIVIYGHSGNISLESIHWLMKHGVGISILNWDGSLLTYIQPKKSVQVKTKFLQYELYRNQPKRVQIARKILEGKFARTQQVLTWLKGRFEDIDDNLNIELKRFRKSKKLPELIQTEARIAKIYWDGIKKVVPKEIEFISRQYVQRPMGSVDTMNTLLNYGYALLEAQCLRSIHTTGLDPHVGYLHEIMNGKHPLVYDLQEPFRVLIDLAIINALEQGVFKKTDFIRTENYNLRLKPSGAKKLIEYVSTTLNKKTEYKGKNCTWHNIIQLKAQELSHYIQNKKTNIDFTQPEINLENRSDNNELREKILSIPYVTWKKQGYSKGTLHHLKQKVKKGVPFTVTKGVKVKMGRI